MDDAYEDMLLARLATPISSYREQVRYHLNALGGLLDVGMDPLEIAARLGGVQVKPVQNGGRTRWHARSTELAPELAVYGDTPDEAKRNLVLRLRRYCPDED